MANFELGEKTLAAIVNRQQTLTSTLIRTPIGIERLGQLLLLAASSSDFNLPNIGGLMSHTSFQATLVEVVNCGCAAYTQAHTDVQELSLNANRIPSSTLDILNIILGDGHEHAKEPMEDLAATIEKCESLMEGAMGKFAQVIDLVRDVGEYLIQAAATVPAEISDVLKNTVAELSTGKDLWREITKFFFSFSAMIKIEMKRHFSTLTNAVHKKWNYISALANRLRLIALQIHFISETYMRVSDEHLEPRVRTITNLILVASPEKEEFERIKTECEQDKSAIEGIVAQNLEPLAAEIIERMAATW